MSAFIKNALFVLGLVVLLGLAYLTFFMGGTTTGSLLTTNLAATGQAALETQSFLIKLQDIEKVKIDDSLFRDERFTSLQDFRKELIDEGTGRSNPFSPTE